MSSVIINYQGSILDEEIESHDSTSFPSPSSISTCTSSVTSPPAPKKIKREKVDHAFVEALKSITIIAKKPVTEPEIDDDYHFSMQILASLKRLDNEKRALAKLYILQYLTSIELHHKTHGHICIKVQCSNII